MKYDDIIADCVVCGEGIQANHACIFVNVKKGQFCCCSCENELNKRIKEGSFEVVLERPGIDGDV